MTEDAGYDRPLQVVTVCGEVIVFGDGVEYVMSPEAAEETSRRLASVAAIARMRTQAPIAFPPGRNASLPVA